MHFNHLDFIFFIIIILLFYILYVILKHECDEKLLCYVWFLKSIKKK